MGFLIEGGGGVFSSILASGYYDELWVTKVPQVFGQQGTPFFPDASTLPLNLSLSSVESYGKDVVMMYQNQDAFSV